MKKSKLDQNKEALCSRFMSAHRETEDWLSRIPEAEKKALLADKDAKAFLNGFRGLARSYADEGTVIPDDEK